jgi:hypothetical protein
MATTPRSNVVRKPSSKAKSSKKTAAAVSANLSPAIDLATRLDEDRIRERAYGIWIAERVGRMAENSRTGSAPVTSFSARLSNAARGASARLTKCRRRPGSARCRVVVNERVTPAPKQPHSLCRISPMEHSVEAMLLVLLNFGQTVRPQFGEDVSFAP